MGLTRVALHAGNQIDTRAMMLNKSGVAINDSGSSGFTPKTKPAQYPTRMLWKKFSG
jgi:hypothetical protein